MKFPNFIFRAENSWNLIICLGKSWKFKIIFIFWEINYCRCQGKHEQTFPLIERVRNPSLDAQMLALCQPRNLGCF